MNTKKRYLLTFKTVCGEQTCVLAFVNGQYMFITKMCSQLSFQIDD